MKIMPSFTVAAARLVVENIKSFSDCSIGGPDITKNIERYHQHVDRVKRSRYSVTNDPKVRFLFLSTDGKIKSFHSPVFVEDTNEGGEPVDVIIAVLGDEFFGGAYIKLAPTVLDDVIIVAASAKDSEELKISPLTFNLLDLVVDEQDTKVTPELLHWPSMVHPDSVVPMLLPKVLVLPPAAPAFFDQDITKDLPNGSATDGTTTFSKHWFAIMKYTHQHGQGLSLHNPAHSSFDKKNWEKKKEGYEAIENGGEDLFENIYTEYEIMDPSATVVAEAKKLMVLGQRTMLVEELNSFAPTAPTKNTTTTNASVPFVGLDIKDLASEMTTGIVNGMVKSKETSAESERKEIVADSKSAWRLMLGHKGLDKNDNDILIPVELTPKMTKILEIKDSQHAKRELQKAWKTTISTEKKNKSPVGLGADFEMATITPAFAKSFQNCRILDDNLGDAMDTLDHEISGLNFLSVDHKKSLAKRVNTNRNDKEHEQFSRRKGG